MSITYLKFYETGDEYGWASNFFAITPFVIDGETWRTTEQYFQAMKFRGPKADAHSIEYSNVIREADSPMKVKSLGTQKKHMYGGKWAINKKTDKRIMNAIIDQYKDVKIRPDWEKVKIPVMIRALGYKFAQQTLRQRLMAIPDNALLVEHTTRDTFWADGGDGGTGEKGLNALGKILTAMSHVYKYGDCSHMSPELQNAVKLRKSVPTIKQTTRDIKILSWNINGMRSNLLGPGKYVCKPNKPALTEISTDSNLGEVVTEHDPDILCFQETRCSGDIAGCIKVEGYEQYWNCSHGSGARSGDRYSGVSVWTKIKPKNVYDHLPNLNDDEGRLLLLEFDHFWLLNTYVPNAGTNFDYRTQVWDPALLEFLQTMTMNKKPLVWCGDMNVARAPIDVFWGDPTSSSYDKAALSGVGNSAKAGYTLPERQAMESFLRAGYVDVYRHLYPEEKGAYTWWNMRIPSFRSANKGWRIDYFIVNQALMGKVKDMQILRQAGLLTTPQASDHAAILLTIGV